MVMLNVVRDCLPNVHSKPRSRHSDTWLTIAICPVAVPGLHPITIAPYSRIPIDGSRSDIHSRCIAITIAPTIAVPVTTSVTPASVMIAMS